MNKISLKILPLLKFNSENNKYINELHSIRKICMETKEDRYDYIQNCKSNDGEYFNDYIKKYINMSIFTPEEIKNDILGNKLIINHITHNGVHLHIIIPENDNNKKININKILHSCLFMKKLASYEKEINVILYFGNYKKKYNGNPILGPDEINSGVTFKFGYEDYKLIFIWRKEELIKVLIHELIHYMDIDTDKNNILISNIIDTRINIIGNNSSQEGYTEFLALILNSIFVGCYTNIDPNILYNYEIYFSFLQMAKILNFCNYSFRDLIENKMHLHQNTNVVSYFFIKNMYLINYNRLHNKMNNNIYIHDKINILCDIINKTIGSKKYYDIMDHYIAQIKKMNKNDIYNTLRLSCIELDIAQ